MGSTILDLAELPALIDSAQAARVIGCHKNSVMRMCRSGAFFSAIKVGGNWRINTADFLRWIGLEDDVEAVREELKKQGDQELPDDDELIDERPIPVVTVVEGKRYVRFARPEHRHPATDLIG